MISTLRYATLLGALAAAAASQAVVFNFTGTASGITPTTTAYTTTQIAGISQSAAPFNAVTSGAVALAGTASTFTFGAGTANALVVTFNATTDGNGGTATSYASTGTLTTATGTFAPYLNTTVAVSSNTLPSIGFNTFAINGDVQAVPEPSAFAALGLGIAAVVRRRRRA